MRPLEKHDVLSQSDELGIFSVRPVCKDPVQYDIRCGLPSVVRKVFPYQEAAAIDEKTHCHRRYPQYCGNVLHRDYFKRK